MWFTFRDSTLIPSELKLMGLSKGSSKRLQNGTCLTLRMFSRKFFLISQTIWIFKWAKRISITWTEYPKMIDKVSFLKFRNKFWKFPSGPWSFSDFVGWKRLFGTGFSKVLPRLKQSGLLGLIWLLRWFNRWPWFMREIPTSGLCLLISKGRDMWERLLMEVFVSKRIEFWNWGPSIWSKTRLKIWSYFLTIRAFWYFQVTFWPQWKCNPKWFPMRFLMNSLKKPFKELFNWIGLKRRKLVLILLSIRPRIILKVLTIKWVPSKVSFSVWISFLFQVYFNMTIWLTRSDLW